MVVSIAPRSQGQSKPISTPEQIKRDRDKVNQGVADAIDNAVTKLSPYIDEGHIKDHIKDLIASLFPGKRTPVPTGEDGTTEEGKKTTPISEKI